MKLFLLTVALAACVLSFGCQTGSRRQADERLTAAQSREIPDVPVPSGFRMDLKHSYYNIDNSTALRTGYATYTGHASLRNLIDFYKDNMPISGWALVSESGQSGSYTMRFDKADERVEVKITPDVFTCDVGISFWPRGLAKK
jgi:hypothetical protein